MGWGSGLPGGEPWEVSRGESGLCGADGHRLTDRGGRGLAVDSGTGERESGCVWLRVVACECECVLLGHSLLGLIYECPSASIRLSLAAAEGSLPYAMWTLLPWLLLGSDSCPSLRGLCAAEVAARLSPLHSPFD
jgi:hypothetical protein